MRQAVLQIPISQVREMSRRWLVALSILAFVTAFEALVPGAAMAKGGATPPQDASLPTGAIVGIIASFALAGLLLMIALPFILPKPPGK